MTYKKSAAGVKLPTVGLGTWTFGGSMSSDNSRDSESIEAIRQAVEMGYTHIDTAEMYGDGHAEELVGKAIEGVPRDSLFITTKVLGSHLAHDQVIAAMDRSLGRLGLDHVDLYLIHGPNSATPLEETFRALNSLQKQGKARYLGVSNFDLTQLQSAVALCETPLLTNQVKYNLFSRTPEHNGVLRYCQEQGMLLTAYEPFDKGRLFAKAAELEPIARRYSITPAQVAVSWLIARQSVITIPMSSRVDHLRSNLEAAEIELAGADLSTLDTLIS